MFLLDTNVVSELRRSKPHGAVVAWLESVPAEALFLSAVTLAEIQRGIELTRETDASKANEIETWLDSVGSTLSVLPLTGAICRRWARLQHHKPREVIEDLLIAATAIEHDLLVVTRNVKDYQGLGVRWFNPFESRKK
ncbi:MAG: type II toxin-antitoxin system VapC family toxin [Polyangiaceae bacterium]|nr:type II toxin-antitoxin system VapC family toxin [Polyangiaceae bacterium]